MKRSQAGGRSERPDARVVTVEHSQRGAIKMPGNPIKMGSAPLTELGAASPLGGDKDEVYRDLLGLDGSEIDRLRRDGVI